MTTSKTTPSRRRKCTSRVKSGCLDCKKARIKCDEAKPSCLNCATAGRICGGYGNVFRNVVLTVSSDMQQKEKCSVQPPICMDLKLYESLDPIDLGLPVEPQDRFYFYYFRHKAAREISSQLCGADFWNAYVLPISISSLPVQHAVIALACQYKQFTEQATQPRNNLASFPNADKTCPALHYYGRAIKSLKDRLASSQVERVMEETLITCLIFISLNILQGDDAGALTHLEGGLAMCSKFRSIVRKMTTSGPQEMCFNPAAVRQLMEAFIRLDLQATSYLGSYQMKSAILDISDRKKLNPTTCSKFESLLAAQDFQERHVLNVTHFLASTAEQYKYAATVPLHVTHQQECLLDDLRKWYDAFQQFCQQSSQVPKALNNTKVSTLLIRHHASTIALAVCLSPYESAYDEFQPLFHDITTHAEAMLHQPLSSSHDTKKRQKLFDLDMSLIQPLYYTALKCRDTTTRMHAIELLRECGKEGVWDGDVMGRIAEHVVALEEAERRWDLVDDKMRIAERNRICGVGIGLMRRERKVWVGCSFRSWVPEEVDECSPREEREDARLGNNDVDGGWEFREDMIQL